MDIIEDSYIKNLIYERNILKLIPNNGIERIQKKDIKERLEFCNYLNLSNNAISEHINSLDLIFTISGQLEEDIISYSKYIDELVTKIFEQKRDLIDFLTNKTNEFNSNFGLFLNEQMEKYLDKKDDDSAILTYDFNSLFYPLHKELQKYFLIDPVCSLLIKKTKIIIDIYYTIKKSNSKFIEHINELKDNYSKTENHLVLFLKEINKANRHID